MIRCPECGCKYTFVVDSRKNSQQEAIRRRRQCQRCQHRFRTYEVREIDFGRWLEKIRKANTGRIIDDAIASLQDDADGEWIVK